MGTPTVVVSMKQKRKFSTLLVLTVLTKAVTSVLVSSAMIPVRPSLRPHIQPSLDRHFRILTSPLSPVHVFHAKRLRKCRKCARKCTRPPESANPTWESNTQLRPHVTILKESRLQRMMVSSELVPHGQAKVQALRLDYSQPQLFSLVHTFTSFRPSLAARSVFRANSAKYL